MASLPLYPQWLGERLPGPHGEEKGQCSHLPLSRACHFVGSFEAGGACWYQRSVDSVKGELLKSVSPSVTMKHHCHFLNVDVIFHHSNLLLRGIFKEQNFPFSTILFNWSFVKKMSGIETSSGETLCYSDSSNIGLVTFAHLVTFAPLSIHSFICSIKNFRSCLLCVGPTRTFSGILHAPPG